jgi:hypothetical protein
MKHTKLIIFKVNGEPKEQIDGNDITIDQMDIMKTNIAIMHGVSFDEVDIDIQDDYIPEISSNLIVREDGLFMFRPNQYAIFKPVEGVRPALDLNHPELFEEFLDLLSKNSCEAFIFS